jgi:hypothetical protein
MKMYVLPTKNGNWRAVSMTAQRYERWHRAFYGWFERTGRRLLVSPEMWME